ncbi:SDR family oxidoreductase [Streptomyces sp. R302]|uniref:SDR family oxidoreductase n=1 Tax=unclassified Streptomyces TaxID=2593676 RepID=UPI00145CA5F1|nr:MULTISPECIES: SDR family oxidoreductase [unclassified Streptomyces]NML53656.1 SDR family oxidoreductase [Streptomyces sp. R301]NML82017.1 SDR family oxidoreductase [Streptomyces sp. R302]
MSTILVTGGTGTLGTPVCERLRADGHEVRVLSRHSPPYAVDLRKGGPLLDRAVDGVDAVVHCSNILRGDEEAARLLIDAARRAGVPHLLYISIVGVDRVPRRYFRTKYAVERMIQASGIPWTLLRATQFHDLVLQLLQILAKPPVMPLPKEVRVQPVEATEAAARLAELAAGPPAGRVEDLGGPEIRTFPDLARAYLRASGRRRRLVEVPLPGGVYRELRRGGHLAPDRAVGRLTFDEFLARRFGPPRADPS